MPAARSPMAALRRSRPIPGSSKPTWGAADVAAILRLVDIDGYYDTVQILNHVSLEVAEGGFTVILGANGAGKTTVFRAINGVLWTEGSILYEGREIGNRRPDWIARH